MNPLLGAHFANLAMNSAQAYEQYRLLQVFARHHPDARNVVIGVDATWCETGTEIKKYTFRQFPEWMYGENRWRPFLEMFNLYTIEQAGLQFSELTGLKPVRYGFDGYASFLPDESKYDPDKVRHNLATETIWGATPAGDLTQANVLTDPMLREMLASFPAETRKVLLFVPYYAGSDVAPGDYPIPLAAECKRRLSAMAAASPGTTVIDFMIGSSITRDPMNYWDPLHTRVAIADRVAIEIAAAMRGKPSDNGDYRILYPN